MCGRVVCGECECLQISSQKFVGPWKLEGRLTQLPSQGSFDGPGYVNVTRRKSSVSSYSLGTLTVTVTDILRDNLCWFQAVRALTSCSPRVVDEVGRVCGGFGFIL